LSHKELMLLSQSVPDGVLDILARYAAIVDDRRIERLFVDQGPACACTGECCDAPDAGTVLAWLRGDDEASQSRTGSWRHAFARG